MNTMLLAVASLVGLGSAACKNYIGVTSPDSYPFYLYPVGQCWDQTNFESSWQANAIWICESDGNGGTKAVEYDVGTDCDTSTKTATGREQSCNALIVVNGTDTCACEIGGTADECDFYEYTYYNWNLFGETQCDKTEYSTTRYVVNQCVVDYEYDGYGSRDERSIMYGCDGYDYDREFFYNLDCKADTDSPSKSPTTITPTTSPTEATDAPSMAPTNSETTDQPTMAPSRPNGCGEEQCNGFEGPRADAKAYSVLFAAVAVFINALNQ